MGKSTRFLQQPHTHKWRFNHHRYRSFDSCRNFRRWKWVFDMTGQRNVRPNFLLWLLKLWFGTLCASILCNCCIVGVMSLMMKEAPIHNAEYTYLLLIFYGAMILVLAIGASTLFLNYSKRIRENKVCRFASFFLVPLLMVAGDIASRASHSLDWKDIIVLCPVYVAFFPCLTGAYIWFLRRMCRFSHT